MTDVNNKAIAGRSLAEWKKLARQDDCFDRMVPSDLRCILAAIEAPVQEPLRIPSVMQHGPTFVSDRAAAPPHWLTAPGETAALRAKLAEVERERDELQAAIDSIETSHGLTSNGSMWRFWCGIANEHLAARKAAEADRDEERKLADDLAMSLTEVSSRCGPLAEDGKRAKAVLARHAARRKEQQG